MWLRARGRTLPRDAPTGSGVACRPRRRRCPCPPAVRRGAAARQATVTALPRRQHRLGRRRRSSKQLPFPRRHVSSRLLAPFPKTKPVNPSITTVLRPSHQMSTLVPSSPHPAKQKSMDHGVLPLPYPTLRSLPSLLFLLASHRHRDAKGRAGHAAAPWHTTRRER